MKEENAFSSDDEETDGNKRAKNEITNFIWGVRFLRLFKNETRFLASFLTKIRWRVSTQKRTIEEFR